MAKQPAPFPIFGTPRLRLRLFRAEDAGPTHEWFANPEAIRYWPVVRSSLFSLKLRGSDRSDDSHRPGEPHDRHVA